MRLWEGDSLPGFLGPLREGLRVFLRVLHEVKILLDAERLVRIDLVPVCSIEGFPPYLFEFLVANRLPFNAVRWLEEDGVLLEDRIPLFEVINRDGPSQ